MSENEPLLSIEDLKVYFEDSQGFLDGLLSEPDAVRAVDSVDLEIHEKEVIALVGESGCGKTTLGKAAIALQEPTSGSVKYRGQDIWEAKRGDGQADIPFDEIRRSLQIIHQDPGSSLNPNERVLAILSKPMEIWEPELDAEDRKARIHGMLDRVGMSPPSDYAQRYPHQLSGGETQRIALIRSLLMNPDLILADEPISALDVSLRIDMMELLLDLQDQFNTSFLFISHNLSNARYLAEKTNGSIGIMYLGEIIEMGAPDEVLNDPKHPYTKALKWATPNIHPDSGDTGDPPVRDIDIPDPIDPPSGCRFHTRCPEAREVCTREVPGLIQTDPDSERQSACFRAYDDHEYWDSASITEVDHLEIDETDSGQGTADD